LLVLTVIFVPLAPKRLAWSKLAPKPVVAPANVNGIILVEAGAAIPAGAEVQVDATGRAIPKAAGISNGYAWDAAVAAGDLIRIVRGI
jgi:hypothetical protein